jgi:tetratricopeptide (TPR) repeat protein
VDDQDSRGFSEFQKCCTEAFSKVPCSPPDGYTMEEMCIPYLAPFSYREQIVFGGQETESSARRLIEAYSRIAANMQRLAPQGTALRDGKPAATRATLQVALVIASQDEALSKELSAELMRDGIECVIFGNRTFDNDLLPELSRMACAVAIVTPAFAESTTARSMLQVVTDLGRPIIPAIFATIQPMPLLLADKASVDCTDSVPGSASRLAQAIKAALAPERQQVSRVGSVFLSYASEDGPTAHYLYDYLSNRGFSVWFDREEIKPGSPWQLEIEQAMKEADVMVALVSSASTTSRRVQSEWAFYLSNLRKPVIPVLTGAAQLPFLFSRTQAIDLSRIQPLDELGKGTGAFEQIAEAIRSRLDQTQREMPESEEIDRKVSPEQESWNRNAWLSFCPKPRPLSSGQRWHVFLSYRSRHRTWVLNLYDILRQQGFQVFMEQLALRPGVHVPGALVDELQRSQCAILVLSGAPDESDWARREYVALERMAMESPDFYFVPVTIAGGAIPRFASERVYIDFTAYPDGPNGGELLRLMHAIVAQPLTADAARFAAEQDVAAQQAANDIGAAIRNRDPELLLELFAAGGLPWRTSATLGCKAAEGLIKLGTNDDAIHILSQIEKEFPRAVRPRQLRALALARRGAKGDLRLAQRILGALYEAGERDPETLGIYGRTWMDRYAQSNDISDLRQSRDLYAEAFEASPEDYYTGINAASKSALLGMADDLERAGQYAARVQKIVGTDPRPGDYWLTATIAETFLLRGDYTAAARVYEAAIAMAPHEEASHQSTWTQACRLMAKLHPSPEQQALVRAAFEHLPDCT